MISLIVASLHRTSEVERLLASLDAQQFRNFEVIVVDQNPDDRLVPVLASHRGAPIVHLHCPPGASRARNLGLQAAKGNVIGFPDDDCWYAPGVLSQVHDWFESHADCDGVLGMLLDEDNRPTGPKWPKEVSAATKATLWRAGITPVAFLSRRAVQAVGFFDERVGPGTPAGYHSGEDLDYLLRCLEQGLCVVHDPALVVHHPSFHGPDRMREKSYSYALGGGHALRAHKYPLGTVLESVFRAAGASVLYLCKGNLLLARSYALRAMGVLRGYFFGSSDLKKDGGEFPLDG